MNSIPRGRTTIRIAAALFILSALLEVISLTAEVPLFGGVRGGAVALVYHVVYVIAFLTVGVGLWRARPWGYWAVMVTTALYTIDKAQLLLARETMRSYVTKLLSSVPDLSQTVPAELLLQTFSLMYVTFIACWWGFALYIHLRRQYFARAPDGAVQA